MVFGMWISPVSEWRGSACRTVSCDFGAFAHTDHAVDFAALLYQQALGRDVAVHDAGRLNLHAFIGVNAAADFAADDRLARHHVAFDRAAFRHQHLAPRADSPHHRAFHFHDALGGDVADDAHAGPDD